MAEDIQYFLVDGRPVKWKPAIAGGSVTLVWDEAAGQFVTDLSLIDRLLSPDEQVTSVDEATFESALAGRRGTTAISRRRPHPARGPMLMALQPYDHSREPIEDVLRALTETGMHWFILGVETTDGRQRAIVVESTSLAVAAIVGDGTHFGEVHVPTEADLHAIAARYGLQAI